MSDKKIFVLIIYFLFTPHYALSQPQCEAETPESTRIYFANGMINSESDALISREELRQLLNSSPSNTYQTSYNENEDWFTQLLEVYAQRKEDQLLEVKSEEFWYWLSNMEEAPQWFQTQYQQSMEQFQESSVYNDPNLIEHVNQYVQDIYNGKSVVIVAHSQGNFYANNAYRRIQNEYSEYQQYVGIVGVASPANSVLGWNNYNKSFPDGLYYTTNESDLIINLVRAFYPSTLPPNPAGGYSNGFFNTNHGFVSTYLDKYGPFRDRIQDNIIRTISEVPIPEKDPECQQVSVQTDPATNISATSAQLNGTILTGHKVDAAFIIKPSYESSPLSCFDFEATFSNYKAGDTFASSVYVQPSTTYYYRFCGRDENNITVNGAIKSFTTNSGGLPCGSPFSPPTGGTEGLNVSYTMGSQAGYVLAEFEAYSIKDMAIIWQGGNKIFDTRDYVSGCWYKVIYHNPNNGTVWDVQVYGNSNTGTAWDLNISCPSSTQPTSSDFKLCSPP